MWVMSVAIYRRYVDMYTSAYQRHSPTVGLHAEGLALQCLSFMKDMVAFFDITACIIISICLCFINCM